MASRRYSTWIISCLSLAWLLGSACSEEAWAASAQEEHASKGPPHGKPRPKYRPPTSLADHSRSDASLRTPQREATCFERAGYGSGPTRGNSLPTPVEVCAHILRLSMTALPDDAPASLREEHRSALIKDCPPGCLREGTAAANRCILEATTIQQAAAVNHERDRTHLITGGAGFIGASLSTTSWPWVTASPAWTPPPLTGLGPMTRSPASRETCATVLKSSASFRAQIGSCTSRRLWRR